MGLERLGDPFWIPKIRWQKDKKNMMRGALSPVRGAITGVQHLQLHALNFIDDFNYVELWICADYIFPGILELLPSK